jgi:hypothetical protein
MAETSKVTQNGTGTGTVTPPIPPAELEKFEKIYTFRGRDEVIDFI